MPRACRACATCEIVDAVRTKMVFLSGSTPRFAITNPSYAPLPREISAGARQTARHLEAVKPSHAVVGIHEDNPTMRRLAGLG
jgi:hypothetical protein